MALFKAFIGTSDELEALASKHAGYVYFTTDDSFLHVDVDTGKMDPSHPDQHLIERFTINSPSVKYADGLRYYDKKTGQWKEIDAEDMAALTGVVGVATGGTGLEAVAKNALLVGDTEDSLKEVAAPGVQGGVLYAPAAASGATEGEAPRFVDVLPVAQGGTGVSTFDSFVTKLIEDGDLINKPTLDEAVANVANIKVHNFDLPTGLSWQQVTTASGTKYSVTYQALSEKLVCKSKDDGVHSYPLLILRAGATEAQRQAYGRLISATIEDNMQSITFEASQVPQVAIPFAIQETV